jgi:hypothetical protein
VFTPLFQLVYLAGTLVAFVTIAYLTRAKSRRVAGALCSVGVFTLLSGPIDGVGGAMGWWTYPSCADPPHPPIVVYVGQALVFVGCLALIGWRAQRSFGPRSVVVLAPLVCVVGAARDFAVAAALPEMIRMGPLPSSLLADMAAWGVVVLVGLGVSRLVAGPATADALR